MVLSDADRREIADMLMAFTERMTTGRQVKTAEEQALEVLGRAIAPTVMGPRYVPLEEQIIGAAIETAIVPTKRKKAMTKFNKAVKEGMKIVRSSSSYGKKGTISNSKKAFSAVTKSVSKARKGGKLPKKGVMRKVQSKAKAIIGKATAKVKARGKRPPRGGTIFSDRGKIPAVFDPANYYIGKKRGPG
jgi:hypothetical protein